MSKINKNKKLNKTQKHAHFHWVHLIAGFVLGGYFVLSKINLVSALTNRNFINSFIQVYVFGIFFACVFLFLFSHEKFFPVAKDIEKQQIKKEKKYLNKYIHHGKVIATFLIGIIGGPVFSSLTARILLNNFAFKYLVVILANIPSTIITVALAKGVIHFL